MQLPQPLNSDVRDAMTGRVKVLAYRQLPQPLNSDVRDAMTGRVKVLAYRLAAAMAD